MNGHKRPYFSEKCVYNFQKLRGNLKKLNPQFETQLLKTCTKFQMCSLCEVGGEFLPKHGSPENTDFLEAERRN